MYCEGENGLRLPCAEIGVSLATYLLLVLLSSSKFQVIYWVTSRRSLRHLKWSTVSLGTCIESREKKVLQEENSSHLKSKKPSSHLCFFMGYACSEDRLITRELLLSAWNQGDVILQAPVQITVCYHLSGLLSKMIFLVYIVQSAFSDMNFILFSPWLSQGK